MAVNANKTGLTCGTTYHFRTKATNSAGTGYGADKTFTTNACIPQPSQYTVTPSVTANGTVNPSTPQTVAAGALKTFTVTPAVGYIKDFIVGGTCPQGSWNENNRWTTGSITANCSVIFNFTEQPTAWLSPTNPYVTVSGKLALNLRVDSFGSPINNYNFNVNFDPTKLRIDTNFQDEAGTCNSGVCKGANALSNVSANVDVVTGKLTLIGFDNQGVGPNYNLELVTIHFLAMPNTSVTPVNLTLVNLLTNGVSQNIGNGLTGNAMVTVQRYQCGDANGDTFINIIDALSIARQIIGLPPPPSITPVADVNTNGEISIVDAMHIARYSLGLVVVGTCLM